MFMCPRLFLYLTLSTGVVLGSLGPFTVRYLGSEDNICQKFKEIVFYQVNLCYLGIDEKIWLQEQKLWEIFPGQRGPEPFFEKGSQGCCIISVYMGRKAKTMVLLRRARLAHLQLRLINGYLK